MDLVSSHKSFVFMFSKCFFFFFMLVKGIKRAILWECSCDIIQSNAFLCWMVWSNAIFSGQDKRAAAFSKAGMLEVSGLEWVSAVIVVTDSCTCGNEHSTPAACSITSSKTQRAASPDRITPGMWVTSKNLLWPYPHCSSESCIFWW